MSLGGVKFYKQNKQWKIDKILTVRSVVSTGVNMPNLQWIHYYTKNMKARESCFTL